MDKREFIKLFVLMAPVAVIGDSEKMKIDSEWKVLTDSDVKIHWRHDKDRLMCRFRAPTSGWLAVGFNNKPGIRDTRFVIASLSTPEMKVEEHLALVPDHQTVKSLGYAPCLLSASGSYRHGYSELKFAFKDTIARKPALSLAQGESIYLMLAWSHSVDFDHHSAWRRHYKISL